MPSVGWDAPGFQAFKAANDMCNKCSGYPLKGTLWLGEFYGGAQ